MRGIAAAKLDEALERRWRGKVRRGLALQLSRRLDGQESFLLFKRGGLRVPLLGPELTTLDEVTRDDESNGKRRFVVRGRDRGWK